MSTTPRQLALLIVAAAGQLYRSVAPEDFGQLFTLDADGRHTDVNRQTARALWNAELIVGIGSQTWDDRQVKRERVQPTIKGASAVARNRSSVQIVQLLVEHRA